MDLDLAHAHFIKSNRNVGLKPKNSAVLCVCGNTLHNKHKKLTAWAHLGKYHIELTNLCVCNTPSTTCLSTTSVPMTAGLWGLGYFLQAAVATVSHG